MQDEEALQRYEDNHMERFEISAYTKSSMRHVQRILNDIESIDMVSLLSYSVHAVQGHVCLFVLLHFLYMSKTQNELCLCRCLVSDFIL